MSCGVLARIIIVIFWGALLLGCQPKEDGQARDEKPVAQVDAAALYRSEIAQLIPKGSSAADSVALAGRYTDAWVRKQVRLAKALEQVPPDAAGLERRVQEYRESLILHEFEKQYIRQHLDTAVSEQEITGYYNNNLANFELKQNIVQGQLVAVPRDAPRLDQARQWMESGKPSEQQEFRSYCYRFARFYHMADSLWVPFSDLVHNTPFAGVANEVQFLKQNNFSETSDEKNVYWLLVRQFRLPGQTSPLPFVHSRIREMVINKRKQTLLQDLDKKVYEEARSQNRIRLYTN